MADVQIAVIDQQNTEVTVAVPGIQGIQGQTGDVAVAQDGTAGTPGIRFQNDTNTGIYRPGTDQLAISTNGTGRLFVNASGNVGIGTSNVTRNLVVQSASQSDILIRSGNTNYAQLLFGDTDAEYRGAISYDHQTDKLNLVSAGSTVVTIDSSGRVGIGTTSPGAQVDINSTAAYGLRINHATAPFQSFTVNGTQTFTIGANSGGGGSFYYGTGNVEAARIDSSGRLLVGTSSARSNFFNGSYTPRLQLESASNGANSSIALISAGNGAYNEANIILAKSRGNSVGDNTIVQSGDDVGGISFQGSDGAEYVSAARIAVEIDGTPGANDMPGRLVFSTTADGASSPTERMRIDSSGRLLVGTSSARSQQGVVPRLQVEGTTYDGLSLAVNNPSADACPVIVMGKSRGGTLSSSASVSNGDRLAALFIQGADGTDIESSAAAIEAYVDGTPGASDMPGRLVFSTTAAGASTPTERMRIDSSGDVSITGSENYLYLYSTYIVGTNARVRMRAVGAGGGSGYGGDFRVSTRDSNNNWNTDAFVVDNTGHVGIGTTTVNTTLEVFNSSTPIIRVGDGVRHMELRGGSTTQNAAIGTNYAGSFDIIQNGSPAATIDSSGRLLVGTNAGTAKLTVQDARVEVRNTNGASIGNSTTTSVSTTATTIIDDAGFQGRLWVINGADASNRFCDLVMASTSVAPVVVQSFSALGTPAARTYTRSGSAVQLAMASGTYDVRCIGFGA